MPVTAYSKKWDIDKMHKYIPKGQTPWNSGKMIIYVPIEAPNPVTTALHHTSKYEGNKHSPNMIVKIRQTNER